MPEPGRFPRLRTNPTVGVLLAMMVPVAIPAAAQAPDQPAIPVSDPSDGQDDQQDQRAVLSEQQPLKLSERQRSEIAELIEALGSSEFAERERAASRLLQAGLPILDELRRAAKESGDAEIRLRTQQLVKQLTHGDLEARIDAFLKGEEVGFQGWRDAREILGDSNAIRELFVEVMRAHPDVLTSLEGTARDRVMAMDATVTRIQTAMFIESKFPTRADAFALLLPAIYPDVELNSPFEMLLMDVLRKEAASKLRRDAHLNRPFADLLGRWIRRSTLGNREDVLLTGMAWDSEATLTLAVRTLGESNQAETLAVALQAIARFGDLDHVALIRPLLDDKRAAAEQGYTRTTLVQTQLGDVVMATIAILHKVPLKEAGFPDASEHPTFGFLVTEVGFPVGDEKARALAREKIDKLLKVDATKEDS